MSLLLLLLLTCLAWGGAPVREPDAPLKVYLVTISPGEEAASVFGHTVLRIRDEEADEDLAWNWGVARFPPVLLPWYFVAGRMPFTTEVRSWAST
ncbi:MAG: DUF4105 domain-containing protein, partial [Deltaproteobacteria bacterium]|nr:DUF4105 domain-containing protein [Deltaproteobacteria bacterium]